MGHGERYLRYLPLEFHEFAIESHEWDWKIEDDQIDQLSCCALKFHVDFFKGTYTTPKV